jgi:aspartate/methionine/tyrosine aminotransferase
LIEIFAKGGGIEIDENILKIFREHFNNDDIDKCSVFGKDKNKNANGMRGGWVELNDKLTKRTIKLIKDQADKIHKHKDTSGTKTSTKTNQNQKRGCK